MFLHRLVILEKRERRFVVRSDELIIDQWGIFDGKIPTMHEVDDQNKLVTGEVFVVFLVPVAKDMVGDDVGLHDDSLWLLKSVHLILTDTIISLLRWSKFVDLLREMFLQAFPIVFGIFQEYTWTTMWSIVVEELFVCW